MFQWDPEVNSLVFWPVMLVIVAVLGWVALAVH